MKHVRMFAVVAICGLLAVACSGNQTKSTKQHVKEAIGNEQAANSETFARVSKSQPVPSFDYSQERQTLEDILTLRAQGTHGTAWAVTISGNLLWWCPTKGAPIPSTYQLTPSTQYADIPGDHSEELRVVDQGEPTGVYPGDSAATWTECLDDHGTPFAQYEENNVHWTSGVVDGLPSDKRAKVDEITFKFTTK